MYNFLKKKKKIFKLRIFNSPIKIETSRIFSKLSSSKNSNPRKKKKHVYQEVENNYNVNRLEAQGR